MIKNLLLSMLSLFIYSCASYYDVNATNATKYHTPTQIDKNYNISGRFIIKTADNNKYGNFVWSRESEIENLNFNTPIGTTIASIHVESNFASLITEKRSYSGKNLEFLMQQNLGFSLPISYLHYWIQGVSLPQYPIDKKYTNGFEQLGWKVEYLQWFDNNHPEILQLTKQKLVIKLLINWS